MSSSTASKSGYGDTSEKYHNEVYGIFASKVRRGLARSTLQFPQSCMLNVLELRKIVSFEIAFSLLSAYAEHLVRPTLVTVHHSQHVPTFLVSHFLSETGYL